MTHAQRLAEIICERVAAIDGKTLGPSFWNTKEWKSRYIRQVQSASALLKIYDYEAIYKTLINHPKVHTLCAKFFHGLVEDAQRKLDIQKKLAEQNSKLEVASVNTTPRPTHSKNRKLRGL